MIWQRFQQEEVNSQQDMICMLLQIMIFRFLHILRLRLGLDLQWIYLMDILELFSKYQALKKELKSYGLMLNGAAHFLLTYKDGCLYVKKEAICQAREPAPMTIADNYFSALIGALVCGNKKIALFDPGFLTEGRVIKKNEFDESADRKQMFCRIRNTDRHKVNPYILVNYSNTVWTLIDGSKVNYTEGVALQGNLQFCVGDQFVEHGTVYRYMPKEEL